MYCLVCSIILIESDAGYMYCDNRDCQRYGVLVIYGAKWPKDTNTLE